MVFKREILSAELERSFDEWTHLLGESRVLGREGANKRYGPNTEGIKREISGALYPEKLEEVVAIVKVANQHKIPLYPISRGNNWGYGSSLPPQQHCVIVDLSRMNRILHFDEELGVVTIEPGVTQGQLYEYLEKRRLPFLVPINGGGPSCSLMGPALERGFGNIPYLDHFASLMSLEAVLPDGEVYHSSFHSLGAEVSGRVFKWGVGPYLDGLFTQSNLGIVTKASIALAFKPEIIQQFSLSILKEKKLEELVRRLRHVLKIAGSAMGLIRVMNEVRSLASIKVPYPFDSSSDGAIQPRILSQLCAEYGIPPWFAAGSILGDKKMVAAVRAILNRELGPLGRLKFVTVLESKKREGKSSKVEQLKEARFMITKPSEAGLGEAYWKSGNAERKGNLNPAHDGCGIIWYAPIIPLKSDLARAYVELVKKTCLEYRLDPLYSLIIISDKYFYGITPIVFQIENLDEAKRANACYEALFHGGKALGFLPYRLPSHHIPLIVDKNASFWKLAGRLKSFLDPNRIIAPGRYSVEEGG
jgi:4-cresol dehydrogenase (hydroxylating)